MNDTGRIRSSLSSSLQEAVYRQLKPEDVALELRRIATIDRAHALMLMRTGVLPLSVGRAVLDVIDQLEAMDFDELKGAPAPRGLYLMWEEHLRCRLGERVGGALHIARSRNDINATLTRMQLRDSLYPVLLELIRLNGALLQIAAKGVRTVTVGYTHREPAMPVTVGHQFAGWSTAICRDIHSIFESSSDLRRLPLGAGAIAGTAIPIDTAFTAGVLGFEVPAENSLDAVASRDVVLRVLGSCAVTAVTMSRYAAEIQHWLMDGIGFASLPDELVGSSSQMPQKRNPFLLEIVQSRAMSALGAFVTSCTRMHGTPFSNSVAVGGEGCRGVIDALADVRQTATILRHIATGLELHPDFMRRAADKHAINATAVADRIALSGELSFREAHRLVGAMVTESQERGECLLDVAKERTSVELERLDPESVAFTSMYGGGPSPTAVELQLENLRRTQQGFSVRLRSERRRVRSADRRLRSLCDSVLNGSEEV